MERLSGIPASGGVVIGKAFVLEDESLDIPLYRLREAELAGEWQRFHLALRAVKDEIKGLRELSAKKEDNEQAQIFEAYLLMLDDDSYFGQIKQCMETRLENVETAVRDVSQSMIQKLLAADDPYLRERAVDISDVSNRLLYRLMGKKRQELTGFTEDVILVARDLLPLDIFSLDKKRIKGIALDMGSRTCHTAILARAFGIPAVLGLFSASGHVRNGDEIIVDGNGGELLVGPDGDTRDLYEKLICRLSRKAEELFAFRDLRAMTKDGRGAAILANIEFPEEAAEALRYGAEGIGLYRSEFLFLKPGHLPEEETQYEAYCRVLELMGDRPVTMRTVDLGADKLLPNQVNDERNPLLGWRAIRFCVALPGLFKTQLRALLRASTLGNLRIMFPMISGVEELQSALALFEEARAECREKGQAFREDIPVGIMIEVPAAAVTADSLARGAAFFSIGTNDLIQYSLAADRGNEKVNYLAQPLHPAVLRLIKGSIDAAHAAGIKAAMCGEMAGDPRLVPLLLGMGLDEFSMTASSIPAVKRVISETTFEECRALADEVLKLGSYKEIDALVDGWAARFKMVQINV